jgi:CheY-like chemotaxis protein
MSSQPPGHPEEGAHSSPSDDLSQRAYLANLRHELRTPINAIIGYAEMLLEDSGAPGAASSALAEGLNEVLAAGNRLLAVVNEVLDPDKIETGPVDVEKFQAGLRAELRDPVNNILRTGERLRGQASDLGDEDAASDLMKIQSAAESFRLMIEDLVKYSLAQPGEAPPDGSDGQAAAMIEDVVGTLRELDQEQAAAGPGEGTGSLLVVDDNAINRDVLQRRVERQGHGVSVAENGRRALQMLAAQKFDLVLLDVIMPEMNGYQVLQAMKNDTALRDIPVIMISALDEMDSVVRAIEMGAEDYLTKPFNPVLLRARIGASLEKKRLRDKEV